MVTLNLLLVGHGNMGAALLGGWQDAGLIREAVVVEPHHNPSYHPERSEESFAGAQDDKCSFVVDAGQIPSDFTPDLIVLAVKPQVMTETLPNYRHFTGRSAFLSIAAGKTIGFLERQLGPEAAIIRAMPNLPAMVRRGVSVCAANIATTEAQKQAATRLLAAVGTVHWTDEAQLDAVTALSGSGPAYVFYLAEMLVQIGAGLGLTPDLANALARETIAGAGELLVRSPDPAALLREKVTSPGGTTEAALKLLMKNEELFGILRAALEAAAHRAAELAE